MQDSYSWSRNWRNHDGQQVVRQPSAGNRKQRTFDYNCGQESRARIPARYVVHSLWSVQGQTRPGKTQGEFSAQGGGIHCFPIHRVDPEKNTVYLERGELLYGLLIIASDGDIDPSEQKRLTSKLWQRNIFVFYTIDGAMKLQKAMRTFRGGNVVLNVDIPC